MEHLASEYDPEKGHFTFTIDDETEAELSPQQYVEFISQSMALVQFVVEKYFNGSMRKFMGATNGKKKKLPSLPANSKEFAEDIDKWLRAKVEKTDFGA
jgi:hypothetical protein